MVDADAELESPGGCAAVPCARVCQPGIENERVPLTVPAASSGAAQALTLSRSPKSQMLTGAGWGGAGPFLPPGGLASSALVPSRQSKVRDGRREHGRRASKPRLPELPPVKAGSGRNSGKGGTKAKTRRQTTLTARPSRSQV